MDDFIGNIRHKIITLNNSKKFLLKYLGKQVKECNHKGDFQNRNNHFWHDMLCMDVNLCYSDESANQTHV